MAEAHPTGTPLYSQVYDRKKALSRKNVDPTLGKTETNIRAQAKSLVEMHCSSKVSTLI